VAFYVDDYLERLLPGFDDELVQQYRADALAPKRRQQRDIEPTNFVF